MINLGDKVKDKITSFTGIAVAKTLWLSGCARITVQPEKLGKDGKIAATETFDEPQLIVVKPAQVAEGNRAIGGPRPEPVRVPSVGR